jgi:hypothetical protein
MSASLSLYDQDLQGIWQVLPATGIASVTALQVPITTHAPLATPEVLKMNALQLLVDFHPSSYNNNDSAATSPTGHDRSRPWRRSLKSQFFCIPRYCR